MVFVLTRRAGLCMLALAIVAFSNPVIAADTLTKVFTVGEGGSLDLDTDRGSIEVHASQAPTVEIEVRISGYKSEDFTVDFSQSGDDVTIVGDYPHRSSWGRSPKIHFRISVPTRYNVDLKTSGGSISVHDLEGEVRVKTSGGSLNLGNIQGDVWGKTSGGSIELGNCSGKANIRTSGGGIQIGDVQGEVEAHTSGGSISIAHARATVHAETSGGSIDVDEVMGTIHASTSGGSVHASISEQPQGDCRLTTSGGSVTVRLADHLALDLSAHGSKNRVKCDFDLTSQTKNNKSLSGKLNGGGPELYLRTSGGSVQILRR